MFSFNELKLIKYYKNFCGFDLFIEAILIDTYFKLTPLNKHKLEGFKTDQGKLLQIRLLWNNIIFYKKKIMKKHLILHKIF